MYKWHQNSSSVVISFKIPVNITKGDINSEITSTKISIGVKGYANNCEGTFFSNIKGSKWGIKDNIVQVVVEKAQPGKWTQLLSIVDESPKAMVQFEYIPTQPSDEELSLQLNEIITIISKDESGWWEGSKLSLCGVFPSNFVVEFPQDYQPPEDIEASKEYDLNGSGNSIAVAQPVEAKAKAPMGINLMGGGGGMDELKNKLLIRKTQNLSPQDVEESLKQQQQQQQEPEVDLTSSGSGSFVKVEPTKTRNPRVQLTRNSSQHSPLNPTQPQPPTQTQAPTPQPVVKEVQQPTTPKETSQPAVKQEKESKPEKEPKEKTSLFKNPLMKKITAVASFASHIGSDSDKDKDKNSGKPRARATFDFTTTEQGELSLKKGEIVTIINKDTSGWWQGVNSSGQSGWFSNAFVEELPEETKKPEKTKVEKEKPVQEKKSTVKSPPSTPKVIDSKLTALQDTPKLEQIKRPTPGAKGRKPPSRVRASYLLSPEEREEREKIKSSFHSTQVGVFRKEDFDDDQDDTSNEASYSSPNKLSNSGEIGYPLNGSSGSFSPPQEQPPKLPSFKPPPPPKRTPMNTSADNTVLAETSSQPLSGLSGSGSVPPPTMKPVPPKASLKPTQPTTETPSTVVESTETPSTTAPTPPKGPILKKPIPKPRANLPPLSDSSNSITPVSTTTSTSPPITNTVKSSEGQSPEPVRKPLKTVPPKEQPISNQSDQPTNELAEKLSRQSQKAESEKTTDTTQTQQPIQKAPAKPPPQRLKKEAPPTQQQPSTTNSSADTLSPTGVSSPPVSSPPPIKPKLVPRSQQQSNSTTPESAQSQPNSSPPTIKKSTSPLMQQQEINPISPPPPLAPLSSLSNGEKQLSITLDSFNDVCLEISKICDQVDQSFTEKDHQEISNNFKHRYPGLVKSFFSVAVCSVDGQFWGNNDTMNDHPIPMFQCIYPFLYTILCQELGIEEVSKSIGESLEKQDKKGDNPFSLGGQLVAAHLYATKYSSSMQRLSQFLQTIQHFVHSNISCDMVCYISQKSDPSEEVITAHLLKKQSLINKPEDILDFFYQLNSIQLNSKQISLLTAALAGEGICPVSQQLSIASPQVISKTNEILKNCQHPQNALTDLFKDTPITPLLSESGILILIVPGLMGISISNPCTLDHMNPSEYHLEFSKQLLNIILK
ncbi:SH3 domain-containing protein [Tieghemostelium lacteum]|uniref:glutaminase n=1 Tax=Tieghemostelium lacteum TaxID=361077 RepID=A0A151ZGH4_TIELA|nr:SH3 domain-containing protein [Tieghemostelium lacteum]|eukprot:KYQ93072.1 SH3 domain-containing protein [Tieghemostelium lacteum]